MSTKECERCRETFLLVDDDPISVAMLRGFLRNAGYPEPVVYNYPEQALEALRHCDFEVALIDLLMPQMHGTEVLRRIKAISPETVCVMVTVLDDVSEAVGAMKDGAFDYLVKPMTIAAFGAAMRKALEFAEFTRCVSLPEGDWKTGGHEFFSDLICEDPAMVSVLRRAELMARNDYTVLVTGESGTGKELVARAIHRASRFSEGPFVAVNIASIPSDLFEDALFGHERGAFTGASGRQKGYLDAAEGGTLFLDEISELRYDLQVKLLRVLQEHEYYPVGSTEVRRLGARIIAATNKNLAECMETRSFRQDLYYRLNACSVQIPPLRERRGDVIPLAKHFLSTHAKRCGSPVSRLHQDLAAYLDAYEFPGNVRELENMVISGLIQESTPTLRLASLQTAPAHEVDIPSLSMSLEEAEKRHILDILERVGGNRSLAAKSLEIGRSTLQRKLKQYGLADVVSN